MHCVLKKATLLWQKSWQKFKAKESGKPSKVALLHQEASPAHKSCGCNAAVCGYGFEVP